MLTKADIIRDECAHEYAKKMCDTYCIVEEKTGVVQDLTWLSEKVEYTETNICTQKHINTYMQIEHKPTFYLVIVAMIAMLFMFAFAASYTTKFLKKK